VILWYDLSYGKGDHLEDPSGRWEDIIKMDIQEVGWGHGWD